MTGNPKNLKICEFGHHFYKSSSCNVCPVYENLRKPNYGYLTKIGAPARRALESHGIKDLLDLTRYNSSEIAQWHGIGPNALLKMKLALHESGLDFLKEA